MPDFVTPEWIAALLPVLAYLLTQYAKRWEAATGLTSKQLSAVVALILAVGSVAVGTTVLPGGVPALPSWGGDVMAFVGAAITWGEMWGAQFLYIWKLAQFLHNLISPKTSPVKAFNGH